MKLPAFSLRVMFLILTVIAGSLAALLRPTDFAAFCLALIMSIMLLVAIAVGIGATRSARASCLAFVACTLLILYQNDEERTFLLANAASQRLDRETSELD
jgi:phosphotransferase system  glucose/maltose/N-acetylglucosamine-specific IIC component